MPPVAPDFGEDSVDRAVEALSAAWGKWKSADSGLEQRIFQVPPAEARPAIQHALDAFCAVLDKRRSYSDAVSAYIDRSRAEPHPRQVVVSLAAVFQDHVQLLGFNLGRLTAKLATLRDSPYWIAVRRAVKTESTEVLNLQDTRRSEMPVELSLHRTQPASLISTLLYRDSEREVADVLRRLWSRYYQALADATEPKVPSRPLRSNQ